MGTSFERDFSGGVFFIAKTINNFKDLNNYIKEIREEWKNWTFDKQTEEEVALEEILYQRYVYKLNELEELEYYIDDESTEAEKHKLEIMKRDVANSFVWVRLANNENLIDEKGQIIINDRGEPIKKGFDKPFNIKLVNPSDKKTCPLWFILSRLAKLNFNVYLTPAIFRLGKGEQHFRRLQSNTKSIQSIILDFDYKTDEEKTLFNNLKSSSTEKIIEHFTVKNVIRQFSHKKQYYEYVEKAIKPNRIMCSGRGFQVEYFLDKPFILTDKGQETFKEVLKGIINKQGSDTACSDTSRYFRLDYSLNVKEQIIPTTTYHLDLEAYSIEELDRFLGNNTIRSRKSERAEQKETEKRVAEAHNKQIRTKAQEAAEKENYTSELKENIYQDKIISIQEYESIKQAMQEDKHNYYVKLSYKDVNLTREKRKEKIKEERKKKVFLARLKELNEVLIPYRNDKGIVDGYRTHYIFIAAKTYQYFWDSFDFILEQCREINNLFLKPLTETELYNIVYYGYYSKAYIKRGEKEVLLKDILISNAKVQQLLRISEEEQRILHHFSYFKEHRKLKDQIYNKTYYQQHKEKLKEKAKKHRKDTYEHKMFAKYENYFNILEQNPKATNKELAELMNVKLRQVYNIKNKYKEYLAYQKEVRGA